MKSISVLKDILTVEGEALLEKVLWILLLQRRGYHSEISQDQLLVMGLTVILIRTAIKWAKALLTIIYLEMTTILTISIFYSVRANVNSVLLIVFAFFVGETLVLLSSIFLLTYYTGSRWGRLLLRW